jgi:hypothetical protein
MLTVAATLTREEALIYTRVSITETSSSIW